MAEITLYHNPNCSKSRGTKEIPEAKGVDFEVVEYLKTPLAAEQLGALLSLLPDAPGELVRKDSHFRELGLDAGDYTTCWAEVPVICWQRTPICLTMV